MSIFGNLWQFNFVRNSGYCDGPQRLEVSLVSIVASDILHAAGNAKVVDKVHFCAQSESVFTAALRRLDRDKPIICGMEAHVCVLQTALGLKEAGYDPFFSTDAMASRSTGDYATAIERFRQNGIEVVTCEMVVFEWLQRADTSEFRDLLALIKERPAGPGKQSPPIAN